MDISDGVRSKKLIHQCNKGKKSKLHASKTTHSLILGKNILDKVDLNNSKKKISINGSHYFIITLYMIAKNYYRVCSTLSSPEKFQEIRSKKLIHQCNKGKKSKLHASKTTHSLILGKKILDKVDLNNSKSRNAKIFE
ncbi:GTP-binding protein REM 2-like isoform X2 [Vespula maculifrons]|uniref:GTP-binding protein REM 2-like isoform X2 n=1 Tax=Vespula maculifrons TaxID=7453 RepID=A0ABD2BHM0_VESMC